MKPFLFFFLILSLTACSKQVRINRKLDGSWILVSINGTNLPANNITYRQFVFARNGNKTGTVAIHTESTTAGAYHLQGMYTLNNDGELKLDMEDMNGNPALVNYEVKEFSNKEMVFVDGNGDESLLRVE